MEDVVGGVDGTSLWNRPFLGDFISPLSLPLFLLRMSFESSDSKASENINERKITEDSILTTVEPV